MKARWTTLAMTVVLVLLLVTSGFAAQVLFEDHFATFDPSWGVESEKIHVDHGKLIINGQTNLTYNYLNQTGVLPNDMDASFTMSFTKAEEPEYGSGFLFWARDYDAWYSFLINPNGWFAVQRFDAGHYSMPVTWRESDVIAKGEGRVNQVKVVTKGNQATVFVNGEKVISLTGDPPKGGSLIGFRVASGSEGSNSVAFSDLQVVQP
jgi:3-keto-disaccharide hydrolase